MRSFIYNSSNNNIVNNSDIIKRIIVDKHNPTIKVVLIEVFYFMVFSHHLPNLMKGDGLLGNCELININSASGFCKSYLGKIIFFMFIFFILHYIILKNVKKIDLKKHLK
jgi:hypothetical protein